MYKRKYKPGKRLSVDEAISLILGEQFVYYRHKICHFGWACSWSLSTIKRAANKGYLREALKNDNP